MDQKQINGVLVFNKANVKTCSRWKQRKGKKAGAERMGSRSHL